MFTWARRKLIGAFFLSLLFGTLTRGETVLAAERILYIPLDDRPVNLAYTVDTFKKAGVDVVTPPSELLSSASRKGNPDALVKWLQEEGPFAEAAVVAADSLIYGGLTTSRTHELSEAVLNERVKVLLDFKARHIDIPIYAFATIMRSPKWSSAPQEPQYYAQWGPKLFLWGALRDKKAMGQLSRKEDKKLAALQKEIPVSIQEDLLQRRQKNAAVLSQLYDAAEAGTFDYFLIARDDSAPYSEAHHDARSLLQGRKKSYTIRSFSGTDEMGMILLTRAYYKARGLTPLVYGFYAPGAGKETVPDYEDGTIAHSYREHVWALGGYPAKRAKRADLVAGIYTPQDGVTRGADGMSNTDVVTLGMTAFLDQAEAYLRAGYAVGIADIAFGNGSSKGLIKGLFERRLPHSDEPMAYDLASYAGWNTASNSLGYTLGQGLMARHMLSQERKDLLNVRYLDDWAYEAVVRQRLRAEYTYPNKWQEGKFTPKEKGILHTALQKEMKEQAFPYLGQRVDDYTFDLPWNRTFEVSVVKKTLK